MVEKTTNHICSRKELISSTTDTVNEDGVKMCEKQSWEDEYKQTTYKLEKRNEAHLVSSHSNDSKESRGSDSKHCAIDEMFKRLADELCMLQKKVDKSAVSTLISTIRRDVFNKKAALKYSRHFGDCKSYAKIILISTTCFYSSPHLSIKFTERDPMTNVISVLYIEIVNGVMERSSKLPCAKKKVRQLENVVHNFQALVVSWFGKYQPSGICTEKSHVMGHLGDKIRQYGNMQMQDLDLYDSRRAVSMIGYRRKCRLRSWCIEQRVCRVRKVVYM